MFSALPFEEPTPSVEGGDDTIKQELLGLGQSIDKAARAAQFYQQTSLRLATQCRVLVHSLQRCMNHFKIACEENLEGDLGRVLRLLQNLQHQPTSFYNEPSRFQHVFNNVMILLLAKRPFVEFEDKTVKEVQERLGEAIAYDRKDFQRTIESAPTVDGPADISPDGPREIFNPERDNLYSMEEYRR